MSNSNFKAIDDLALADLLALEDNSFCVESMNPMNPWWGLMAEFEENPISNKKMLFQSHTLKQTKATKGKRSGIILVPPVKEQKVSPYSFPSFCCPHLTLWKLWGFHPEVVGLKKGLTTFNEMRGGLSYRSYVDFKMIDFS